MNTAEPTCVDCGGSVDDDERTDDGTPVCDECMHDRAAQAASPRPAPEGLGRFIIQRAMKRRLPLAPEDNSERN